MVELQSCPRFVNGPSLCDIERNPGVRAMSGAESYGISAAIEEISAELQRERDRNAVLMERISMLEAEIRERDSNSSRVITGSGCIDIKKERDNKKFKRQKTRRSCNGTVIGKDAKCGTPPTIRLEDANEEGRLVNWLSMQEMQYLQADKYKDDPIAAKCDDSDDTDEDEDVEDYEANTTLGDGEAYTNGHHLKPQVTETSLDKAVSAEDGCRPAKRSSSHRRKPPKLAFCPKEVKKMLESVSVLSKNAESHTIRKIIVFASLGIRHGCDDMHELDFSHFSVVRKGEPYVSPGDPGEHVVYDNPGTKKKIFYPNRQNAELCPVRILEEEKAMRPADPSCPTWLFLCIKYGGRTRNVPQNEYVRQRMGRNKMKSFALRICRMAMLVHVRRGSFFFKALGITLLFMAGFSIDLVRMETKHRNLDLLQKYYRTNEDAEGEELFLHNVTATSDDIPTCHEVTRMSNSTKSKSKEQASSTRKRPRLPRSPASTDQSIASTSLGCRCSEQKADQVINRSTADVLYRNQAQYHNFPLQLCPPDNFMPTLYWPTPNAFAPTLHQYPYGFRPFPSNMNCISIFPQQYYDYPFCSSIPQMIVKREGYDQPLEATKCEDADTSPSSSEA